MNSPLARTRVALCCLAVLCCGLVADASTTRLSPARVRAVQSKMVAPDATLSVEIDVQSSEANRTIDLSSTGSVQIAVLGGKGIDVTTIDPGSLVVSGARPIMISPASGKPGSVDTGTDDTGRGSGANRPALYDTELRDVNGDGRQDLLVAFPIQQLTELEEGLERVRLEGRTFGGTAISGTQTIVARGTRPPVCCDGSQPEAPAATTCNSAAITINDNTTATPYPSAIFVSGETGVISNLTVTLTGISHTFPDDIQMLLVGPGGQKVVLMAGASDGTSITNVNLTFDDAATNNLPTAGAIASGTYKPTAHAGLLNFAAPAPAATPASPFAYTLGAFRGTNPNGTWNLFIRDVFTGDFGSISGGWCVNITTATSAPSCMTLNAGALAAGDPTQTGRLVRNGVFSVCSALKPSPGLNDSVLGRRFDQYTITNQNTTTQCVTASVSNGCGANAIYLAAYSGSYVPTSVTTNFLADNGSSMGSTAVGIGPVAFTMAPGATVVLVVHEITANSGCASYGLLVEGNICPPPCMLTCPANVTTSNTSNQCGAVVNYPAPTTTGSCGTVTCAPASGSFFPVGTTTVTCTPTTGSPCSFTVTVNDTQAPTITCPGNQGAVEAPPGSGSATVNYPAPTVSDNCPSVGAPVCTPASGSSFPLGVTTVNCSVTDAAMNTASCSFSVTVTAGCAITCPANVTASNTANQCGAVVTYPAPTTSGPCGTVTCTPASGSFFPVGTTTVTCSETSGAMCTFTVTVNDTQAPAITCPANVTANNTPGMCSAVVTYGAVSATDNCTAPAIMCSQPSGSTFPVGTTTVTCTATDAASNTATCSFTVTVNDTQAPTITCPANVTATANTMQGGVPGANVFYPAPTTSDNCPGSVTVVCTPASGSFFPQGTTTVNCTATDPGGNMASCSFTVSVSVAFDVCFNDEANGNTLSFVTNPLSPLYRLWQFRIALTGQILQGSAEFLSYNPARSLVAYDRDSATVRMDTNASFTSHTATATILDRTTGVSYAFRDRDTTNNPPCGGAPPPPTD
jgi:subtilisin-like proprotein convertase family protein